MPEITIVIPVYNSEKFLMRCVDSVLAQSFTDFELILVNDGSKDNSGAICDEYSHSDTRVKVIHKKNEGVSSARNVALESAKGKYVAFVDADDWVEPDYLGNLLKGFDEEDVDLVFNYAVVHINESEDKEHYPEKKVKLQNISDLLEHNDLIWHTSPWSKLFKRSIIERAKLRFPLNMHIGEDAVFLYEYIFCCRKINVICTCDYHYIIDNSASLTRRINVFESECMGYDKIVTIKNKLVAITGYSDELSKMYAWFTGSYHRRCLIALYHDDIKRSERLKYLKSQDFSDYISGIKENSRQGKLYNILLKNGMFQSYDMLRSCVSKIVK